MWIKMSRSRALILSLLAVVVLLWGCATSLPVCAPGLSLMSEAQLFFGGSIAAEQWNAFVDQEIATRFPGGFTVLDTEGRWRNRDGETVRETGHELIVLFTGNGREHALIAGIRESYKRRFTQESVLLSENPVCAAF